MIPVTLLRIARQALEAAGYEVAFRRQGWVDCLVWSGEERWIGRGGTESEALADAVGHMFPSRASMELLQAQGDVQAAAGGLLLDEESYAGSDDSEPPDDPALLAAHVLEAAQQLERDVEEYEPIVAGLPPDRQRLWLLIWICRVRSFQERAPESPELAETAQRTLRRLTEIAKAFWPGPVRALLPSATPRDIGLGRRQGEMPPDSWKEAADLAEGALEDHLAQGEAAGLDEDGWADADSLDPPPKNADALLDEVSEEIESLSGAPGAPSSVAGLDELSVERITHLARNLRWLRGAVDDRVRWGKAMARLCHMAYALGSRGDPVKAVCDPRHRPAKPWAWATTEAAPRAPSEPPASVGALPAADAGAEALGRWIVRGLEALETPRLAEMLGARRDEVYGLEESLPTSDRRIKRSFRELVRQLVAKDAAPESSQPESSQPESSQPEPPAPEATAPAPDEPAPKAAEAAPKEAEPSEPTAKPETTPEGA